MYITATNNYNNYRTQNITFEGKQHITENILREYIKKGLTNSEIAKELNISPRDITRKINQFGIKSVKQQKKEKNEQIMQELYNLGYSYNKIAEITDLQHNTVNKFFKQQNLPRNKELRYFANIKDKKLREIAQKLNLSKEFIEANLK